MLNDIVMILVWYFLNYLTTELSAHFFNVTIPTLPRDHLLAMFASLSSAHRQAKLQSVNNIIQK